MSCHVMLCYIIIESFSYIYFNSQIILIIISLAKKIYL